MGVQGLTERNDMIAAISTICTETTAYWPIPEWGSGEEYQGRADLGNLAPGSGVRYKGRGFLQLTGFYNYQHYGEVLGLDLVNNPDLALDVGVSCLILARYFVERGTADYARAGNWTEVRITVNGGLNGWSRFWYLVQALEADPPPIPLLKVIIDTELRSEPVLTSVVKPIVLLRKGTLVQKLGPYTPHWTYIRMSNGHIGWVYTANLIRI